MSKSGTVRASIGRQANASMPVNPQANEGVALSDFGKQIVSSQVYFPRFQLVITINDIMAMLIRHGKAYRIWRDLVDDAVGAWFNIEGVSSKVAESINATFKRLAVKQRAKVATAWALAYGFCPLYVAVEPKAGEPVLKEKGSGGEILPDPAYPLKGAHTIRGLRPIHAGLVSLIETDDDGRPLRYHLMTSGGKARIIHASRIAYFKNMGPDENPKGLSMFLPMYDDLDADTHMRWAFYETAYRNASKIPVLIMPENTPDDTYKAMKSGWGAQGPGTHFVAQGEGWKLLQFGGSDQLDPTKYHNVAMENLAADTGIPSTKLTGAQAGSVTGSEVNDRQYYRAVFRVQDDLMADGLMDLTKILVECGYLSAAALDAEFIGSEIDYTDEKAKAEAEKARADAMSTIVYAMKNAREMGIPYVYAGERMIITDHTFKEGGVAGRQANAEQWALPPGWMLDKFKRERLALKQGLASELVAELIQGPYIGIALKAVNESLGKRGLRGVPTSLTGRGGNAAKVGNAEPPSLMPSDKAAFISEIEGAFREAAEDGTLLLQRHAKTTQDTGAAKTAEWYQLGVSFEVDHPAAMAVWWEQTNAAMANSLIKAPPGATPAYLQTIGNVFDQAIADGKNWEWAASEMRRQLDPNGVLGRKHFVRIARTETARWVTRGNGVVYRSMGITRGQQYGCDPSCDICAPYLGITEPLEVIEDRCPMHPNCEFDILPVQPEFNTPGEMAA